MKTLRQLHLEGYEPVTEPYEEHEDGLFKKAQEQMAGTDFQVGEDQFKRKVICRKRSELKMALK